MEFQRSELKITGTHTSWKKSRDTLTVQNVIVPNMILTENSQTHLIDNSNWLIVKLPKSEHFRTTSSG